MSNGNDPIKPPPPPPPSEPEPTPDSGGNAPPQIALAAGVGGLVGGIIGAVIGSFLH